MPVVSRRLVLGLLSAHASVQVFIELASAASAARSGFGEFVFVRLANLLSAKDELRSLQLWCSVGLRRSNFVHFSQVDMAKCALQPSSAV